MDKYRWLLKEEIDMYFILLLIFVFFLTLFLLKLLINKIPYLLIDVPDFKFTYIS